jgi:hypothetical protein
MKTGVAAGVGCQRVVPGSRAKHFVPRDKVRDELHCFTAGTGSVNRAPGHGTERGVALNQPPPWV